LMASLGFAEGYYTRAVRGPPGSYLVPVRLLLPIPASRAISACSR